MFETHEEAVGRRAIGADRAAILVWCDENCFRMFPQDCDDDEQSITIVPYQELRNYLGVRE